MEQQEFQKKMETLQIPGVHSEQPKELKMTILHSKKSAALGVWFVVIPCYFLFCVVMKYYFKMNLHIFDIMEDFMAHLDNDPATKFIAPIVLVGLPIVSIAMNALAILHVQYDNVKREIIATVKLRFINISMLLISGAIVSIFLLYALVENYHHHTL